MSAKSLMVQGTASSAGKSALVTGLCRLYSRRGLRVAPFKAQNMALNSRITPDGGEIGGAQAAQAEACGLVPSVHMNPVLLKPTSDRRSRVLVNGREEAVMDAREYYAFRHTLKPRVAEAFATLAGDSDLVVIEGAGSPAEINLRENDLVNMGMAAMADAPVILVGDIDRGGVFASLYGTVLLLEPEERARIKGFVINKFRGDESILEPGVRRLEELAGIPVLGVLPYWDIHIEEEDSLAERLERTPQGRADSDIVVLHLPRMANATDFGVFDCFPQVRLRYVKPGADLGAPDMVIVPGSTNIAHDMRLLRETGTADALRAYHARGGIVGGVCGGYRMLGTVIGNPGDPEEGEPEIPGLGLLDVITVFTPRTGALHTSGMVLPVPGILANAAGHTVTGCSAHTGETAWGPAARPLLEGAVCCGAVSADGRVFGACLHGLFDSFPVTRALIDALRRRAGLPPLPEDAGMPATYREYRLAQYDRLADVLEQHLDMPALDAIIRKGAGHA